MRCLSQPSIPRPPAGSALLTVKPFTRKLFDMLITPELQDLLYWECVVSFQNFWRAWGGTTLTRVLPPVNREGRSSSVPAIPSSKVKYFIQHSVIPACNPFIVSSPGLHAFAPGRVMTDVIFYRAAKRLPLQARRYSQPAHPNSSAMRMQCMGASGLLPRRREVPLQASTASFEGASLEEGAARD